MVTIAQGQDITKRKQAEEALKRTERQLYETASRLPGMIFQFYAKQDGSLGLHYVSEQAKRLLGLDPEPKGFFERCTAAFLPEYRDDFLKIVRKTVSEVSEWKYEGAMRKPSGEIVWISGLATPTKRDDEIVYDGVIIDITERKKTEEKLLELKAAVEQSVDGIALADLDGHIRFVNGAWARMHGYSVDELIGRHWGIFHTKEQLETEVNPFIKQLLEAGSGEREIGHVRRNGATFPAWMSCTVLTGADQKPCGLIGTALDITERKQAEEQALIFRRFAEASGQGLGMATLQGQILYMNQTLCRMLDEDNLEDVYKKGFPEYYPPEFSATTAERGLAQGDERRPVGGGIALVSTKGKQTPTIENFFLIRDEEGRPLRLADVITDITERKEMEDDLRKAKHAAQVANRAKSEFLANTSHEIRTPMTAILGYADLLLNENLGRDTREHVAVIKRNGEHLLQVIGDILDLSKIEAEKLQIKPTRCSPVQVVAEVASLMRPQAAAKQLKLKTELAQPLPETVLTDPLRLRQILVNLLGNAIKFTDQGEVRLAVRLIVLGKGTVPFVGRIDSPPDNGPACFDVTDTGIGMDEEQIGKLFQPFSQVDNSSTRKFGGTGLGLCISKHLAEALGGSIEVRSEPAKGSTFSVMIDPGPLDGRHMIQNAQEALLDRPPSATTATPDKIVLHGRILLAEDGLDNQRLIALLLRNAGAHVTRSRERAACRRGRLGRSRGGRTVRRDPD